MPDLTTSPITANGDYDLELGRQARRFFSIGGTWDGATAVFKYDAGGGDYVAFPDGTLTASGGLEGKIPNGKIRVTISGVGASTSLNVEW